MRMIQTAPLLLALLGSPVLSAAADAPGKAPATPATQPKSIFDSGLDPLPTVPGNGKTRPPPPEPASRPSPANAPAIVDWNDAGNALHVDADGVITVDRQVTMILHGLEDKRFMIEGDVEYGRDSFFFFQLRQVAAKRGYMIILSAREQYFGKWHHFSIDAGPADIAVKEGDEKVSHSGPIRTGGSNEFVLAPGAKVRDLKAGIYQSADGPPPALASLAPRPPEAAVAPMPGDLANTPIPLAGTVAELIRNSAQVNSLKYEAEPIVAVADGPAGWRSVAPIFQHAKAVSYSRSKQSTGLAEFEVTRSGYLLLACNWNYQGNRSGGWTSSRLQREDFIQRGWQPVDNAIFGGLSRFESKGDQVLFIKRVEKGEKYTLRCNKYYPPYAIVFE